jgi:N-dimethylarginine dimethylaminohydrolase
VSGVTGVGGVSWGRRYLMCPPRFFGVLYEINPWMHKEVVADPDRAAAQWDGLVATLESAGAKIELMEPVDGCPDLVFTANAGIVNGRQFIPSRFRYPERAAETPHDIAWFESHGYTVEQLPDDLAHEGAGDALPFAGVLLSGYRYRSDAASHPYLSRLTGRRCGRSSWSIRVCTTWT